MQEKCALVGISSHYTPIHLFNTCLLYVLVTVLGTFAASVQFSSVVQSCLTLCDPMNCSTPGLPVHHKLPEFTQEQHNNNNFGFSLFLFYFLRYKAVVYLRPSFFLNVAIYHYKIPFRTSFVESQQALHQTLC